MIIEGYVCQFSVKSEFRVLIISARYTLRLLQGSGVTTKTFMSELQYSVFSDT